MLNVNEKRIKEVCERSMSMSQACAELGMHYNTFKRYAMKYGCYKPNQGGKGMKKDTNLSRLIPLQDILDGKQPQYQTSKLRIRLIKEGILANECLKCGTGDNWQGDPLTLELDHIDGDRTNHKLDNLRILCPNCHSQTETYRSKNRN